MCALQIVLHTPFFVQLLYLRWMCWQQSDPISGPAYSQYSEIPNKSPSGWLDWGLYITLNLDEMKSADPGRRAQYSYLM